MARPSRFLLLLLCGALALIAYAVWVAAPWATAFEWGVTAATTALVLLSIAAGHRVVVRIGIAVAVLVALLAILCATAFGAQLLAYDPWPDRRYAVFLAALLAVAAVGLARRWMPARWLACGLALGGIGTSALNLAPFITYRHPAMWMHAINLAGSILILASLAGQPVRDAFASRASELWRSVDPVVRSLRLAMIVHFAAIPMLLVYAWIQPIVPATGSTAVALAAVLALAVALTAARRVIGAIALVAGGMALVAQTVATIAGAAALDDPDALWISFYYAAFWLPAAATAIAAGARVVPRLRAVWRSRP